MILSERDTQEGRLVTVCDGDVLGETFESDGISLTVTEEFYGGEDADEEAVVDAMGRATVANLVGTDTVEFAIEEGFVAEENVLEVDGTLHAQFLRL